MGNIVTTGDWGFVWVQEGAARLFEDILLHEIGNYTKRRVVSTYTKHRLLLSRRMFEPRCNMFSKYVVSWLKHFNRFIMFRLRPTLSGGRSCRRWKRTPLIERGLWYSLSAGIRTWWRLSEVKCTIKVRVGRTEILVTPYPATHHRPYSPAGAHWGPRRLCIMAPVRVEFNIIFYATPWRSILFSSCPFATEVSWLGYHGTCAWRGIRVLRTHF